MTAAEIAEAKRAIARLKLPVRPFMSRRTRAATLGHLPDWRRTMRASLRGGGVPVLARRERRERWPALVALCDISGSMAAYSRMLLHFLHAAANAKGAGWSKVHVFTFATRLTNITRHLHERDVDEALKRAGREARDWEGGTRIGACLEQFNREWSRRVLGQGAVVLLITDGLDRDDPDRLAREAERLHLSCRRLIWLNPLLRWEGFEARAQGVRALLPHVDAFVSAHNIASLEALAETHRPRRGPGREAAADARAARRLTRAPAATSARAARTTGASDAEAPDAEWAGSGKPSALGHTPGCRDRAADLPFGRRRGRPTCPPNTTASPRSRWNGTNRARAPSWPPSSRPGARAPRPVGSQLAVSGEAEIMGSVSGGCVEGAVVAEALDALEDGRCRVLEFGVSDDDAFAVGLACGGRIRVMVEPVGRARGRTPTSSGAIVEARAGREALARRDRHRRLVAPRARLCRPAGGVRRRPLRLSRGRHALRLGHQPAAEARHRRRRPHRPATVRDGAAGRLRRDRHRPARGLRQRDRASPASTSCTTGPTRRWRRTASTTAPPS